MKVIYSFMIGLILFNFYACTKQQIEEPLTENAKLEITYLDGENKPTEKRTDNILMKLKDDENGFIMVSKKTGENEYTDYLIDNINNSTISMYYTNKSNFPHKIVVIINTIDNAINKTEEAVKVSSGPKNLYILKNDKGDYKNESNQYSNNEEIYLKSLGATTNIIFKVTDAPIGELKGYALVSNESINATDYYEFKDTKGKSYSVNSTLTGNSIEYIIINSVIILYFILITSKILFNFSPVVILV